MPNLTRRAALAGVAAAAASVAHAGETITVADPGGVYSTAWAEAFYRPFEPSGLRILRFLFTPSPRLSQWQLKKIKRRIILERGPVA